jgi:hypothetical protein
MWTLPSAQTRYFFSFLLCCFWKRRGSLIYIYEPSPFRPLTSISRYGLVSYKTNGKLRRSLKAQWIPASYVNLSARMLQSDLQTGMQERCQQRLPLYQIWSSLPCFWTERRTLLMTD